MESKAKAILDAAEPKGQMEEYSALRAEIINQETAETSIYLQMYSFYAALFSAALALNTKEIFLVSYIILILFQLRLNYSVRCVTKVSTYISVFYENRYDIHWEGLHRYLPYEKFYLKEENSLGATLKKYSATVMGLVSTMFYIPSRIDQRIAELFAGQFSGFSFFEKFTLFVKNAQGKDVFYLLLSILLPVILFVCNRNYDNYINNRREKMRKVIEKYKDYVTVKKIIMDKMSK